MNKEKPTLTYYRNSDNFMPVVRFPSTDWERWQQDKKRFLALLKLSGVSYTQSIWGIIVSIKLESNTQHEHWYFVD